jgi:hypothetical protein
LYTTEGQFFEVREARRKIKRVARGLDLEFKKFEVLSMWKL